MNLNFDVVNQTVTRTDKQKTVNWSDDYLRLCFNFVSDDWSDCSKFILVFDGESVYRFALSGDAFVVPEELLTGVKFLFSIYGVNNTYRITTPKIMLRLLEAGYSADVKTLDVDEFTHDVVEEVYLAINSKADANETTAALEGKSDVGHTHTKSEVTDFAHTHVKSEITDFAHNHDDRYYTKSEVDSLIYGLNNKLKLNVDKNVIQTDDTIDLRAFVMEDGMPQQGKVVNFYIDEEEEEE